MTSIRLGPVRRIAQIGLALTLLGGFAAPAQAESSNAPDYARTGFTVALGGVYAIEDFDGKFEDPAGVDRKFDDSAGVDLHFGYRAAPNLAFDFVYEWLEGFDSTAGSPDVELDTHLVTVNAKFYALRGRFQPYASVGIGAYIVNTEIFAKRFDKPFSVDASFTGRFGAGIEIYLTPHIALTLDSAYIVPTSPNGGEQYAAIGAGALYRF